MSLVIVCLCSPLMVNMSPHLVREVRKRETSTGLIIFMLIVMVLCMFVIVVIIAYSVFSVLLYIFINCSSLF